MLRTNELKKQSYLKFLSNHNCECHTWATLQGLLIPTIIWVVGACRTWGLISCSIPRAVSSSGAPQRVHLSRNAEKARWAIETVGVPGGVHVGACRAGQRGACPLRAVVTFGTGVSCGPSVHGGV